MLVKNWMNKKIITIDERSSIADAISLLSDHGCTMLVVTRDRKQVGIVTDRHIKKVTPSESTTMDSFGFHDIVSKITVEAVMSKNPVTVPMDFTIEETALIFLREGISSVAVVDEHGRIVGEITQMEVFKVLISLTGIGKRGIQFAFLVEDRLGVVRDLTDTIRKYGGRMMSTLTSDNQAGQGQRKVYIRMNTIDRKKLDQLIEELKKQTTILYMIDHREGRRVIF